MTLRKLSVLLAQAAVIALGACSDDFYNQGIGSGAIAPVITVDTSVAAGGDAAVPPGVVTAPSAGDFTIIVTDSEGRAVVWEEESASGVPQRLIPGVYRVSAIAGIPGAEGFAQPCFMADTTVTVTDGAPAKVPFTARLANTLVEVSFDPSVAGTLASCSATLHTLNGHYCNYTAADSGPLFLRPGNVTVSLDVTLADGRRAAFNILEIPEALSATYYNVSVTASDAGAWPSVTATASSGQTRTVELTDEFVDAEEPVLSASGFANGEPITLSEGAPPAEPLTATVTSDDLRHLYLTGIAPTLGSAFAAEIDLLDMTSVQSDSLARFGITTEDLAPGEVAAGKVDFSKVVTHLRYVPDAIPSTFSLLAVDGSGRVSDPLVLAVDVRPVDLRLEAVSKAVIGVNKAQLTVASSSPSLEGNLTVQAYDREKRVWTDLTIDAIEPAEGSNLWIVTFTVPPGLDEIDSRILYCGDERATFTVGRSAPSYTLDADPFALHAIVAVRADDPSMTGIVTSTIRFYDRDGNELPLVERHPAEGYVSIAGLEADRTYTLLTSLTADPSADGTGPSLTFRTESDAQLPNEDFEDINFRSILYKDMLCGGRYSQNTVEIYNRQNHASFEHHTPKSWATVNAKTFCRDATNHNTWYLAPSAYTVTDAYSGAYAVRLDCVGYSLHGPDIPDYLQTSRPYTDYSLNTPAEYSRAAGRLFLGTYAFDSATGEERYDEGLRFTSRPSALNGFYKYVASGADILDNALVRVEVLGNPDGAEVVIARGELRLGAAMSYTAFTIPLVYDRFGEKAAAIRIMFAATDHIGDIESETKTVAVTPLPPSATLRGSSLWIDNLSLSY